MDGSERAAHGATSVAPRVPEQPMEGRQQPQARLLRPPRPSRKGTYMNRCEQHAHSYEQQQQHYVGCQAAWHALPQFGAPGVASTSMPGPVYYAPAFYHPGMVQAGWAYVPPPGWAYVAVGTIARAPYAWPVEQEHGWHAAGSTSTSSACGPASTDDTCGESDQRPCTSAHAGADASSSGFEGGIGWDGLPAGVLQIIVGKLSDGDVKHLRLVCTHWRLAADLNMEVLTPNELRSKVLTQRFPNLKALHLTNCSNIRNRCLGLISKAGLQLHTLTLGDDSCRPWVTNQGLHCIAQMTSLTSLNLHDCNGVTNNGLLMLTKLQCLNSLSLKGCQKLTNGAFEAFQGHSALTHLNLFGCRLTDKGLLPLTSLQLVSLHLGNTRVRDEGLSYLARITTLQELHFEQEELSDAGVAQLTTLTRLESLALCDCADVSGDSLSVLIPALPSLMSLHLNNNFTIDDSQLSRCLEFLGAVTFLDLRGTPVTEDGVQQLTKLSQLQKLCLAPTNECLWSPYLGVVSNLTQLTSLSINNCTLISYGQLETLRQLKLLKELDLSHDTCKESVARQAVASRQPVTPTAINAMAEITSLTSIDLSRRPVHQEHLNTLAERLPRLHSLFIVGCPVLYTEVQSLQRRFPDLVIHRRPLYVSGYESSSCSSSDHGIG